MELKAKAAVVLAASDPGQPISILKSYCAIDFEFKSSLEVKFHHPKQI